MDILQRGHASVRLAHFTKQLRQKGCLQAVIQQLESEMGSIQIAQDKGETETETETDCDMIMQKVLYCSMICTAAMKFNSIFFWID